ncbi:hypothetical protein CO121_00385 [bacterium (Candidatus Gribaldobacteria) CG_4_9_14_3_um_filter_36_15]|uniref:Mur ligase central domain-containing protein n=4 Tax=Candidatus Gribaldobacteria TaxID=2798536 RepID=A0A2M7VKD4_9BACT|nr:MAG: hypothetical protein AUK07_01735 [Parcubacteria group bacterium CG2_30_36_21]PIR91168.1 MAG: hypothetical protein COU02_00995 [bacterium (Candidatus Gribaldobacteria) CG10_big_fil_rev_8_21_14_0_10_37_46]PIV14174.1 MAG: hypothetical protein COS44_00355 [bacterium (Candidatus Gribaldobacteria) CG03_land_8_20_14_0_80_36_40]PJA02302.1 MAG: hypothetical protein COX73_01455 [bacterium (Candidatus Gribaldobacteria) CG_4_10_14_0_2_um_filter_36_18]PJB09361.1 MAG: hypothetical protein CO121_00385
MRIFITILWFLLFTKCLFFWLWLWQLKEYHFGRFRAHFEAQKVKKLASSFWRVKFPKFTKKIIVISISGILLEILILFGIYPLQSKGFYLFLLTTLILAPIIFSLLVLLFQIPTVVLRKRILRKARQKREKFKNLLVIGITGSYGKTSTKEFLAAILSKKYNVLKTEEHQNSEIGISQCILNDLKEEHEIFVVEIGAYEQGKIKEVCQMIKPKIGILTGINEQHLSTFGSQENVIKAKFELIESLPQSGLAIFNGDNKYCQQLFQETKVSKNLVHSSDYEFDLKGKNLFLWDIENLSLAATAAEYLGVSREEIENTLAEFESPIEIKKSINNITIIDATYSANPKSVLSHLDYLKDRTGRKVIVMPCLIELGKVSKEVHQRIGEKIGRICDFAIITTKDRFGELRKGALKSGMPEEKILFMEKSDEIFKKIKNFCQEGDIVLLESRVPSKVIKLLSY